MGIHKDRKQRKKNTMSMQRAKRGKLGIPIERYNDKGFNKAHHVRK